MNINFVSALVYSHIYIVDGEDYRGNTITVNVSAGVTMQPLTINIIDNNIVECDEIFYVTIVSFTACGVIIGSNNISEVMIRDDDGKHKIIMISVMSANII